MSNNLQSELSSEQLSGRLPTYRSEKKESQVSSFAAEIQSLSDDVDEFDTHVPPTLSSGAKDAAINSVITIGVLMLLVFLIFIGGVIYCLRLRRKTVIKEYIALLNKTLIAQAVYAGQVLEMTSEKNPDEGSNNEFRNTHQNENQKKIEDGYKEITRMHSELIEYIEKGRFTEPITKLKRNLGIYRERYERLNQTLETMKLFPKNVDRIFPKGWQYEWLNDAAKKKEKEIWAKKRHEEQLAWELEKWKKEHRKEEKYDEQQKEIDRKFKQKKEEERKKIKSIVLHTMD